MTDTDTGVQNFPLNCIITKQIFLYFYLDLFLLLAPAFVFKLDAGSAHQNLKVEDLSVEWDSSGGKTPIQDIRKEKSRTSSPMHSPARSVPLLLLQSEASILIFTPGEGGVAHVAVSFSEGGVSSVPQFPMRGRDLCASVR